MSTVKVRLFPKGLKAGSLRKSIWILLFIALCIALILLLSERVEREVLIVEVVEVSDSKDIVSVTDSLVEPIVYSNIDMLADIGMEERKLKFIDALLPAILIARHKMETERRRIAELEVKLERGDHLNAEDSLFLRDKMTEYRADSVHDLKIRLKPHPASIALAQAALESGWGTSRFFQKANNVFGVWSFDPEESRLKASSARDGQPVYVRSYHSILESVEDYFRVLGSGRAYHDFRTRRSNTDNVFDLIWYLRNYSEKRTQYVIMLRNVIVANNLTKYDHYRLDSRYLTYPSENTYTTYIFREHEE